MVGGQRLKVPVPVTFNHLDRSWLASEQVALASQQIFAPYNTLLLLLAINRAKAIVNGRIEHCYYQWQPLSQNSS